MAGPTSWGGERSRTPLRQAQGSACGFALDYLDADPDDLPPEAADRLASGDLFFPTPDEAAAFGALVNTGCRKLPWRYRWPDTTHDEVLARLLDLNQQRHREEILGGQQAQALRARRQSNTPTIPGLDSS